MLQMKKCFCLMLTALMLASLFGCAGVPAAAAPSQGAQNTAQPTAPVQDANTSGNTGEDWEQPVRQGDPIDLTILEWTTTDRPFALGEGFWADWMQEKFGDVNNIHLVYQIMDRSAETDTLNVWMASGEAPDICYTYDINIVQNYRLQDGLADLTDALAQYGGKLLEYHTAELQEFGQFDGRQMFLLGRRLYTEIVGASIRGDWLDTLNLEKPTTTEEFYQVLTAFKTEDPGKLGDQFIGWGMYPGEMSIGYFNALYSFVDPDLTEKELACIYPFNYPGYKDGVAFMNKLYNEGLIWSEFGLASSADLTSKIVAGNVGFVVENCLSHMNVGGNFDQMAQTVPGAYYVAVDCFTNANGNHPKLSNQPYDKFIFTPAFSDHANEAIMYLNWLCYDTPREAYSFGKVVDEAEKGTGAAYRLDNGVIVTDGNYYDQDMNSGLNFLFNGYDYGSDELNILARTVSYTNDYAETSKEAFGYAGVDSRLDPWFFPFWKITIQSEATYAKAMQEMYKDILITCYSCPQDQFSETYDRMVGEFMELYGNEVCAEREAAWAQIHGE
jgi:putative aldouronate transport system substrate-binding protein